jgi:homoserine kinase
MLKVRVPGSTSNLGSGFDAFGLALQIYLRLEVELDVAGLAIECTGEGADELPANADHLVYRMIRLCFEKSGKAVPGMIIRADNEVPLSRGLGSSGSAIIAGLVIGQALSGLQLSDQEVINIANSVEGHPENIASSYFGGLTINCHTEQGVLCRRILGDKNLRAVTLIPEVFISTNAARAVLPEHISHRDAVFNLQRSALLAHAFVSRDYSDLRTAMQDRLHQAFRAALIPGFTDFEEIAYDCGALAVAVSGSGSTVISFVEGENRELMEAWQTHAAKIDVPAKVILLEVDNDGVICEEV